VERSEEQAAARVAAAPRALAAVPAPSSLPTTSATDAAIRAFNDVAEALGDLHELDELLHLIAAWVCQLTGVPRCSVYLRDEESGLFRGQVAHAERDIDAAIKRLVAGTEADRFTAEIVRSKRPVLIRNAMDDPRPIRAAMRAFNVRAMLGVPMTLRGEVIGILFLDDEGERCAFTDEAIELASTFANLTSVAVSQAQMTAELRRSLATVARQNKVLRRASAVDDRLSALALDGAGVNEIVETVAELTSKPCAVYDADCRLLASAAPAWMEGREAPTLPERATWAHPAVQRALGQIATTRGLVEPVREAGLLHRFLIAPVGSQGAASGLLAVMEHGTRFGPLDPHIARRAATLVSLELAAARRVALAEWDARATLLSELIGGTRDLPALERRAQYFGVDLSRPRVVCLIGAAAGGNGAVPSAAEIVAALQEADRDAGPVGGASPAGAAAADGAAPSTDALCSASASGDVAPESVLAAGVAEGVVLTLALPDGVLSRAAIAGARERLERCLARFAASHELIGAVSACCRDARDYKRAFGEAKQVLRCLTTLAGGQPSSVLTADDLGPGRLFLASADRADAERFAHDALGPVLTSAPGMADLLQTLRVFFDSSRSVRRSAQQLDVHENTIRYRLARIEELTGLAVASSSEDQLTVQLALLILRVCGWEAPAPESLAQLAPASAA
jgi:sugar diacid utilization regulator